MKLTKLYIDKARYSKENGKPDYRWDDSLTGFGIRIYPSGKKSFVITYRINGRKRFMILGAFGHITLDQARKIAHQKLSNVIEGSDPLDSKKESGHGDNIESLCNHYIERHAKPHKKTWEEDQRRIIKYIIPAFGSKLVKNLTRNEVYSLHHEIGKDAPYEANRILALLSVILEMAVKWEILPETHPNPARKIQKFKEEKRDRYVTHDEMPRLAKAINQEENIYIRSALWLYLFTGMRKNELLRLGWSDIDLTQKQIRLGDTKSGRPHYLPISETAIKIINAIPKKDDNAHLFPGKIKGKPLVNIEKNWRRVRHQANLDDVRLHDLRRTVGSWLAIQGSSLYLIGKVLNHTDPNTTAVYAHLSQDPIKEALEKHGNLIMELTGENDGNNEESD